MRSCEEERRHGGPIKSKTKLHQPIKCRKCIVNFCGITSTVNPQMTFFTFPPYNTPQFYLWCNALMQTPEEIGCSTQYICHRHFTKDDFQSTPFILKLLNGAIPSLNLCHNIDLTTDDEDIHEVN